MPGRGRLSFAPDPARARRLDGRMRARLGVSLDYILEQAEGLLEAPEGFGAFRARLAEDPVDPQVFGAYYELVLAIEDDALEAAQDLLAEMASTPPRPAGLRIRPLGDPEQCAFSRRYRLLIDTDPDWPLVITAPSPESAERTRALVASALALLDRAHPALAGELRALVAEVVLADSESAPRGETFDGVSSFMLWGGLVLHAGSHETPLEMAEALAHESAHSLLFGLSSDGPLLENEDDERFASPLRSDPRPLDGIYHATFVTARMHHALRHLRDHAGLEAAERDWIDARLEVHAKHFAQGLGVLDPHARLTATGRDALEGARDYMRAA